jgi:hypothetical protein
MGRVALRAAGRGPFMAAARGKIVAIDVLATRSG